MRLLVVMFLALLAVFKSQAEGACQVIHGRAHLYSGDGNLRIWHIGTKHDYEPADVASSERFVKWLEAGVQKYGDPTFASPESTVDLFADFLICPTEPFKKGSVQRARFVSARNRHYTSAR